MDPSFTDDIGQFVFIPGHAAGHLGHQAVHRNDFHAHVHIAPAIEKGVLHVEIVLDGEVFPKLYLDRNPLLYKIDLIIGAIGLEPPGYNGLPL